MPSKDDDKILEKKFDKLADQLRQGWIERHHLTDKEKDMVRDTVTRQWEQEQKAKGKEKTETREEKKAGQSKTDTKEKKKTHDAHGLDQSH